MTGRSHYRGGRGGGRGAGRGRGSSTGTTTKPSTKKTISDCCFYVGSSKQASDYELTAEFVINYIKETFNYGKDIGEAVRTLVNPDPEEWKPTLKFSASTDAATKIQEDTQN